MDRISDLPDLLIEKILLFLPLLDAVRTSLLSTKWQYRWTKIPRLIIDMSFCSSTVPNKVDEEPSEDLYLHIVNSLLLQHTGPLEEFSVFLPNLESKEYYANQSIRAVLLRGVKRLAITGSFFTWPSSFPAVSSLTSLEFDSYVFTGYPCLRGFPNLKSLTFHTVVGDLDSLTSFISNCPNLQRIVLKIRGHEGHIGNIFAPKLEYLFVRGKFKSLCLQGAQKVREMELYLDRMCEYPLWDVIDFFSCLVRLESLSLGGFIYKVLALNGHWQKLPKGFGELTVLKLDDVVFADNDVLRCIFCFIRSSPNIRRLEISANLPTSCVLGEELNLQAQGYECCTLAHLENIYIGPIIGTKNELEVIEFLLSCAPALQVMSIWHAKGPNKRLAKARVYKTVTRLSRASPTAKVLISYEVRGPLF